MKLGHRAVAMFGTFMMGVGWIGLAYSNSLITMLACHSLPGGKLWYAVDNIYGRFYGCTAVSKHQPHVACKRLELEMYYRQEHSSLFHIGL